LNASQNRRPAVFLDRDGTIVLERNYLADPDRVELVPGGAAAMRRLHDAGFALVIVTNQSGIARGLYKEADYLRVQERLTSLLAGDGVELAGVYHCPHHPDFTGPCDCRKPAPGLFLRASADLDIDLTRSFFVGDRIKDIQPALIWGARGILVGTGYGKEEQARAGQDYAIVEDLNAAADLILGGHPRTPSTG
jgi:D-glycero-D-manno-heptose 1,7-bisphosphate phosphatase